MDTDIQRLLDALRSDPLLRRRALELPLGGEIAAHFERLPGGVELGYLSPGYSPQALWFSPSLELPPGFELEIAGNFACVTHEGVAELPVQGIEDCGNAGAGRETTPTLDFSGRLFNLGEIPRRLALRLCRASTLPPRFVLFSPAFTHAGRSRTPDPLAFATGPEGRLCIHRVLEQA